MANRIKLTPGVSGAILISVAVLSTMALSDPVPTTVDDFFLPGSQPNQSGNFTSPNQCDNCHGGYNQAVEPAFNWRGSMMSQAARDPLFYAALAIANQDAPSSGELCLRCHTPVGWLGGRSTPPDGSALTSEDLEGVQCAFCHRQVKPSPLGINPYPEDSIYTADTYPEDQSYLATITAIPGWEANGMFVCDANTARRGPFSDADATHQMFYSPFHFHAQICGTCHDVSNPVFLVDSTGHYVPNAFGQASPVFDPHAMFPIERTYSEWSVSEYNSPGGVYAPQFGGNLNFVSTCQDCHLRDVTGKGCNKSWVITRNDLPLHDMTGGNTFVPGLIEAVFPGQSNPAALAEGIERATYMLQNAASLELTVTPQTNTFLAQVMVTNETGHKLPSGYPEGRRMWIHLIALDAGGNTVYESGSYDSTTGILSEDPDLKVYKIEPGISSALAPIVNLPAGPSFHFVLNDTVYSDNRIPPRGFSNANFEAIQSPPVSYSYADGQYWDDTEYVLPANTAQVMATLYYQTTSKEYVEFLRDENTTNDWGQTMYDLWTSHGKCAPVAMASDSAITSPLSPLWVTLTPLGLTTFPPSGGILEYNIAVGNNGSSTETADIWVDVLVPGMVNPYGPILGPVQEFSFPAGFNINRDRALTIPGAAPAGIYNLNAYLGEYSPPNNVIEAEDHLAFEKTATGDGGEFINGWFVDSGESFASPGIGSQQPAESRILGLGPNPFNPITTISYQLSADSHVKLQVYDIAGRLVATLADGWRDAGIQQITFDGSNLPSGIYLYRLSSGDWQAVGKMVLMK